MLKCTFFFSQGNAGWSETLYRISGSLADGIAAMQSLATERVGMCTSDVTMTYLRCVDPANPAIIDKRKIARIGALAQVKDVLNVALTWKVFSTNGSSRVITTRGQPDDVCLNGLFVGSPQFTPKATAWQQKLLSGNWAILTFDRSANQLQQFATVTNAGVLQTFLDQPWGVGDALRFFRSKDTNGKPIKGLYRLLTPTDATHFPLNGWTAGRVGAAGRVRRVITAPSTINFVNGTPNASTHKTGRPFGSPRGRAPARK